LDPEREEISMGMGEAYERLHEVVFRGFCLPVDLVLYPFNVVDCEVGDGWKLRCIY
jgi:hypothetical protein